MSIGSHACCVKTPGLIPSFHDRSHFDLVGNCHYLPLLCLLVGKTCRDPEELSHHCFTPHFNTKYFDPLYCSSFLCTRIALAIKIHRLNRLGFEQKNRLYAGMGVSIDREHPIPAKHSKVVKRKTQTLTLLLSVPGQSRLEKLTS